MGNDPGGETFERDFRDGQADSVDGDRTLVSDVVGEIGQQFDFKPVIGTGFLERKNGGCAIDVTLDEMTVEAGLGQKRSFQIDGAVAAQTLQVCPIECFVEKIKGDLVDPPRGDGEAATIHSDAIATADVWRD